MAGSTRSSKRRRINPPEQPSRISSRNNSRPRRDDDKVLYDNVEGAHDSPSARRSSRSARGRTGHQDIEEVEQTPSKPASARKTNSARQSGRRGPTLSDFLVEEPKRNTTPLVKKRRGRKESAANDLPSDLEDEQDELGDENMSEAEQQLLTEAGLSETPSKRKRRGPPKHPLSDNTRVNGPTPIQKSSRRVVDTSHSNSQTTPTRLRRKLVFQQKARPEDRGELPETEDELQQTDGDVPTAQAMDGKSYASSNIVNSATLKPPRAQKSQKVIKLSESEEQQFELIKHIVLEKLSNRRPIPLTGLEEEYRKVYQLVEATISAGESNSMLLIGARGSGKTTLVNKVIRELSKDQKDDFHVVQLNGFIHTDDKLALREIWRQLGREMEIDDGEGMGPSKSYADTLLMLLSLLSHPSESRNETADDAVAKSVIFVMDEFDLFASHLRQTLLYNLLDIAQSHKAPIAVLGLTTRIDVTDGLEKRVKSRFSHRYVHLGLPRSLSAFAEIVKAAIRLTTDELKFEERTLLLNAPPSTEKPIKKRKSGVQLAAEVNPLTAWNASVDALTVDAAFIRSHVQPIYSTTKSIPSLLSSLLLPISQLTYPTFKAADLISSPTLLPPPSMIALLSSLSDCALALLIAASRLTILHSTDLVNFGLTYAEYASLASKVKLTSFSSGVLAVGATGTRVWSKEVCRGEWERLLGMGLLIPALGMGDAVAGGAASKGMVRVDVALEEIPMAVELSAVMEKWCKQL